MVADQDVDDDHDQEELLNLSLAIVTDHDQKRRSKKKRRVVFSTSSAADQEEGKVFKLLQTREQMLKKILIDQTRKQHDDRYGGLRLIRLLLLTATAVDENNADSVMRNLTELYQAVSLTGDSVQRVVAYFSDGLAARLLTRKSPFYDMILKDPTSEEQFLSFTYLYRASPYYQFAHFTANQAIFEAFNKEQDDNNRALHVIDLDVSYGFQWPSLIQSLSEKATSANKIYLRITGFGRSIEELQETETRLVSFSKGFHNLVFEFRGLLTSPSSPSKLLGLKRKRSETVAVNLVFHLNTLDSSMKISDTLRSVRSLHPSIVTLVEHESCSRSTPRSFLSLFMESLQYFAAMFDSLEDCLPLESAERLSIEKNHLGKEIKSMLNYGDDHHHEKIETWKGRMESHGFSGVEVSSRSMMQAKLLLKMRTHYCPLQFGGENNYINGGGFRVFGRDEGKAISLGWQGRCLLTASAWRCV